MTCGLVILNYNDYETTINLLEHIKNSREIDYICVVDNLSQNNSFDVLKKYQSEKISVIQSEKNGGYSYGNNFGARYLIENFHPEIIGIANPDVIFDDVFIRRVKETFAGNPDYAVLTGIMCDISGKPSPNFYIEESSPYVFLKPLMREIFIRPFEKFSPKIFRSPHQIMLQEILNSPQKLNQVWQIGGSLFFVMAKDFQAMGMLDENVFLYYEEQILAYKVQKLGKKAGIINDIKYIHNHPANPDKNAQLNSGMRFIKNSAISRKYYFNNYLTKNKILRGVHNFLLWLRWLKSFAAFCVKKIILQLRA